ncbi:MAG: Endoglucanase E precursor [Firmicutes bacterium ADurb.Bin419]|nr:MAG: Endoglucanase E precursor [Firmicutes bacterium ADurb.Bin419]
MDPVSGLGGMVATGGRLNVAKALDKVKGSVLIGDIIIDGKVNSGDYSGLNRYILDIITLTPKQLVAADVTGDGKVNSSDYTIMNRYLLDIIQTFPAGDKYTFTYGDVDNDGTVSNSDANIVASYLAGNTVLSDKQLLSADVNGDNVVNGVDLSMLNNYINGMMTYLPVAD